MSLIAVSIQHRIFKHWMPYRVFSSVEFMKDWVTRNENYCNEKAEWYRGDTMFSLDGNNYVWQHIPYINHSVLDDEEGQVDGSNIRC